MEADTAIWLVKKLKNSWSAHTVSDQLTDAALEDIKVARGTLGTPVLVNTRANTRTCTHTLTHVHVRIRTRDGGAIRKHIENVSIHLHRSEM
jgi:hypothetical protein